MAQRKCAAEPGVLTSCVDCGCDLVVAGGQVTAFMGEKCPTGKAHRPAHHGLAATVIRSGPGIKPD